MRDAQAYWDLLRNGGFLIGDDYHKSWPGVVQAAKAFAALTRQRLTIDGPKWILHKPQ